MLADELLDPLGGADRHGRLADDQRLAAQVRRQAGDRRLDVRQVGAHAVGALGGADADEVDVTEVGGLLDVGGEPQPAGGEVARAAARRGRARGSAPAGVQLRDLVGVDVEAEHLVAELREADGVRRAQVAGAEEGHRGRARARRRGHRRDGRRRLGVGVRDRHACLLRSHWRRSSRRVRVAAPARAPAVGWSRRRGSR